MAANRRVGWIFIVAAAAPVTFGGYRVLSLALRNELSASQLIGEALSVLVLAILAHWAIQLLTIQLLMRGNEARALVAALMVSALTLVVATLLYLPQGTTFLQGAILVGICELLIAGYAITALRPNAAAALARKSRLRK